MFFATSSHQCTAALFALCLCTVAQGANAQPADEKVALQWSLQQGEKFKIVFTQTIDTVTTAGKNATRMRMVLGAELKWEVQGVDETGNMQIDQTISRLSMKLSKSDGADEIEYDSASDERPRGAARDVASAAGPLVGIKIQLTLSPRGEVLAVHIPPEARETIEKIQDRSKITSLVTPEGISEVLKQAMPLLPKAPVAAGESWNHQTQKTTASGRIDQTTTLTYDGPDQEMSGLQKLSLTANVTLTPSSEATSKLTLKSQQLTGSIWYDSQSQRVARGSMQQEMVTEAPYRDETVTTRLSTQLEFAMDAIQ